MILIVGANGNIGKRYQCILNNLGIDYIGYDSATDLPLDDAFIQKEVSRILIATPTDKHLDHIREYSKFGHPILCEKPLSKDLKELDRTLVDTKLVPLRMVDNYRFSVEIAQRTSPPFKRPFNGHTHYNYFQTGKDGIAWDCIQIIGLAKGSIDLKNTSDVWDCAINGVYLNLEQIAFGFRAMVKDWLMNDHGDKREIYDIHVKTKEFSAGTSKEVIHICPG